MKIIKFLCTIVLCFYTLYVFKSIPILSIFLSMFLLIFYLISELKLKISFLLFLFPIIVYLLPFFTTGNFLSFGDNEGYTGPVKSTLSFYSNQDNTNLLTSLQSYEGIMFIKIGFIPVILVPDFLYKFDNEVVYFYFQSFYFLFLFFILFFYIITTKFFEDSKKLTYFTLFVLLLPTSFTLGFAPTRHYFTFFSVLLFFFSYESILKKSSFKSFIILFFSLIFTILSKPPYLIPYTLYILYTNRKNFKFTKYPIITFLFITSFILLFFILLFFILPKYQGALTAGIATFNFALKIPLLGLLLKYIIDILSPFPTYDFETISTAFGSNIFYYLFHILGILYISVVVINLVKYFFKNNKEKLDNLTIFGLFMSLSILPANAGYNGYISIFYPLFFYYFKKEKIFTNFIFSLQFLVFINLIFFILKSFIAF